MVLNPSFVSNVTLITTNLLGGREFPAPSNLEPRDEVVGFYGKERLRRVEWFKEPEDHVAIEFEFMAYLCLKEKETLEVGPAVRDQPWDGYITEINGDRYVVPSGTNVGLETGDILEVFDSSRTMEGVGGQRFFIPGLKIGEIEVVTIAENRLEAKLVSGKQIKKGSTVRRE